MSDQDRPELYRQDSPEFYPDEYFVGFDGSTCAGDGYLALAHRNADGTVQVVAVEDREPGMYASYSWRLGGWNALTLRIWSQGQELAAELDRVIEHWAGWVAALPCEEEFDPVGWWTTLAAAWLRRILVSPNPIFPNPDLWRLPPDPIADDSRWTLPDYAWRSSGLPMDSEAFRKLLADSIVEMPKPVWQAVPTKLEVAGYEAVRKSDLPPTAPPTQFPRT